MVEVFVLRLPGESEFVKLKDFYLASLNENRREYFSKFKSSASAMRSIFGELITRKVLSETLGVSPGLIDFKKTENGKPYLETESVHFNLSHSGEWVVFAINRKRTGIDVEKIRPVRYEIAERFFSKEENKILSSLKGAEKLNYFFDLWTLKESYLKMIGTGLTKSLSSFTIILNGNDIRIKEHDSESFVPVYFRQYLVARDYKLSVCSESSDFSEQIEFLDQKILSD
jgi:4'-phosphopantetheinyl transferase